MKPNNQLIEINCKWKKIKIAIRLRLKLVKKSITQPQRSKKPISFSRIENNAIDDTIIKDVRNFSRAKKKVIKDKMHRDTK